MKPLIVAGGVIFAIVICIVIGGKLVNHFQNELGTKHTAPSMSTAQVDAMNAAMEKKNEEEEWKYRRQVRNEEASFSQEDAKMEVPVMREKEVEEAFERKMTAKQIISKVETWLTLGLIIFVGWMVYMRIRKR